MRNTVKYDGFISFWCERSHVRPYQFKPTHSFTYLIESSEELYSIHFIRSLVHGTSRLRLCKVIPAIPATLNLWIPNPDVTILDSSSNKLNIGAFFV